MSPTHRHGFHKLMDRQTWVSGLECLKSTSIPSVKFLGYPGFYPPRPGQEEDVMSQANIKRGLILGEPVPVSKVTHLVISECQYFIKAETFSAHDMIKSRFAHHDALTELEDLMNEIFSRRAEHTPSIPCVKHVVSVASVPL